MEFIKQFEKNCKKFPDVVALKSVTNRNGITYRQLNEQSAKVYTYLKKKNIGKEQMIFICLPRDTAIVVAMLGVIKTGATFVLCEDTYPKDRMAFIRKDCNCIFTIDKKIFEEMMKEQPLYGHKVTSPHDACFAVYTSGSTGTPKGVLHEYGKLVQMAESWCLIAPKLSAGGINALCAPFNFVAAIQTAIGVLYSERCLYILPYKITKDVTKLLELIEKENVKETFLSLGVLKLCKDNLPQGLSLVFAGGESYNNICLHKGICFIATYCSSESAFNISTFVIDKEYDKTPAGKNTIGIEILIFDDVGNRLPAGQIGEICFKNEFTRGYINLPDKTAAAFVDGIYHTGDLGYIEKDGNLFVSGRKDDMIKIDGNRIEPAEIEAAIKNEFGLDNVVVKGFQNENRSFLCVYFLENELKEKKSFREDGSLIISKNEFCDRLSKKLPYYMIPTYYSVLPSYPININGKLDKKQLQEPKIDNYRKEYIAPSNELEEKLCNAFASVLGIECIGVDDDFYEIGGNSINAIKLVEKLNMETLDTGMLFASRTPRNIAKLCEESTSKVLESLAKKNEKALKVDHCLSDEQIFMFDYQFQYPKNTIWNLPLLLKLGHNTDIKRLKKAVDTTLKTHPVFSIRYVFDENTQIVQRYDPNKVFDTLIEAISEADFINESKNLVQPFILLNKPMYRVRIFKTEQGGYLFLDLHHSIADGTSIHILIHDICAVYSGKPLETDYYFISCENKEEKKKSPLFKEAKVYYENLLDRYKWDTCLKTDMETNKNVYGNMSVMIPIDDSSFEKLFNKYGIGKNVFYIAASALAITTYNGSNNIRLSWVYHGRQVASEKNVVGALLRDLYVGVHFNDKKSLKELFDDVKKQVDKNLYYSFYPYPNFAKLNEDSNDASVIYQMNLRNISTKGPLEFTVVNIPEKNAYVTNLLNIEIQETDKGCMLNIDYNACAYKKESIYKFKMILLKTACTLMEHLDEPEMKVADIHKVK